MVSPFQRAGSYIGAQTQYTRTQLTSRNHSNSTLQDSKENVQHHTRLCPLEEVLGCAPAKEYARLEILVFMHKLGEEVQMGESPSQRADRS
ncbi:hypothetical protein ACFXTI_008008 [Malus domestica]